MNVTKEINGYLKLPKIFFRWSKWKFDNGSNLNFYTQSMTWVLSSPMVFKRVGQGF